MLKQLLVGVIFQLQFILYLSQCAAGVARGWFRCRETCNPRIIIFRDRMRAGRYCTIRTVTQIILANFRNVCNSKVWENLRSCSWKLCSVFGLIIIRSQQHSFGTVCPTTSRQPIRCRLSGSNWNTHCSRHYRVTFL